MTDISNSTAHRQLSPLLASLVLAAARLKLDVPATWTPYDDTQQDLTGTEE